MRPTLFGIRAMVFYVLVVGAFYAAPYENLFFLLLAFLTVHWQLAAWWTWRSLDGVELALVDAMVLPAGAASRIIARLDAATGRRFDVTVRLVVVAKGHAKAMPIEGTVEVLRGRADVAVEVPPMPRGVHTVERVTLCSTWPFGLLRRTLDVEGPREVVVYPAPSTVVEDGRSAAELVRELMGTSAAGAGDLQPSGLREHRAGDGLRSVHWRASARRGALVVREWEGGSGEGLTVVLDRRCSGVDLEGALAELSAIVTLAREAKETLAVKSQDFSHTFGDGHEPWERALRFLAAAETLDAGAPAPPASSPSVLRLPRSPSRV